MPIRSIKRHLHRWAEAHWDYIDLHLDEMGAGHMDDEGNVIFTQKRELPVEILGRTSVWIGEAVYNMRSALDYLVYALAVAGNSGKDVKGTQFPIEDTMDNFTGRITGTHPKTGDSMRAFLKHVPTIAVARFRQLQPCWKPPCKWTRTLADLSNPDKHRFLTELRSNAVVVAGHHPLIAHLPAEAKTHPNLVVQVSFRKSGLDVVDTLELLQREVSAVIKEFEPSFKRPT